MAQSTADAKTWGMLAILALIWGGSFLFVGIAVKELPALLIVFARVGLAAAILIPIHWWLVGPLPRDRRVWIACFGMSVLNNVLPFTAISWGQHFIASGLAAVINATTPMFTLIFMALAGLEKLTLQRIVALCIGLAGVVILKGGNFGDLGPQSLGILAVIFASTCYGLSAPWSKLKLTGIAPLTIATCQLTGSTVVMAVLAAAFSEPQLYLEVSLKTWGVLILLAALSTAIAYLIFFRIIARAGPSFVSLVTMLVPISGVLLGVAVLGEKLSIHEIWGGLVILLALVIIDGRFVRLFKQQQASQ
jgi:drug/metabolite transporter (DMT)-like permease